MTLNVIMAGASVSQREKRPMVERIFPRPVRRLFRTLNYHATERGRIIHRIAKTLPQEERAIVVEQGKRFCVARSKKNLPRGTRNVAASIVIGQGMWYVVCPMLSEIPGIRDTPVGWLAWGGSDKLFLASDQILYHTGGYSTTFAGQIAEAVPKTVAFGGAMVALEVLSDLSRCWIEYWTQRKYGIVADGAARLYGQTRPFLVRFSALEAYQKIISYALRPWTIGTPRQIFSSIQGIMGSLWRVGPQLALVVTVGRAIDKFFKKIAEWTGLKRLADRIRKSAEKKERQAMEKIRECVGDEKFLMLKYMLAAHSRKIWRWNPFKPALSVKKAAKAAIVTYRFRDLQKRLANAADPRFRKIKDGFQQTMSECLEGVTDIFGRKMLMQIPEYKKVSEMIGSEGWAGAGLPELQAAAQDFSKTLETLQTEKELS